MQFRVRFYDDADGNKPLLAFLEDLRKRDRILHKLVVAGIKKLEEGERHGPPLTALVDQQEVLFELRVGQRPQRSMRGACDEHAPMLSSLLPARRQEQLGRNIYRHRQMTFPVCRTAVIY